MSDEIVSRLTAAKDALMAKGHDCPSVEIGCKVLGKYGPVWWAVIHLGSPKNWCDWGDVNSLNEALDASDAALPSIPTKGQMDAVLARANAKLNDAEREAIRMDRRL